MKRESRGLVYGLGTSLVFWLVFLWLGSGDLAVIGGDTTDHLSHISTTVLFEERGFDVYRSPVAAQCRPLARRGAEAYALPLGVDPGDVCNLEGREDRRPLFINWRDHPKPYPPGLFLYTRIEASLYDDTEVSTATINRLTVSKMIIVGHLLIGVFFVLLARPPPVSAEDPPTKAASAVRLTVLGLIYYEVMMWTMMGIYDGVSVLFVVLALERLEADRPASAVLCFGGAVFLHFRALWALPILGLALWRVFQARDSATGRDWAQLGLAAILAGVSGYAFVLVWPSLGTFPDWNPVLLEKVTSWDVSVLNFYPLLALVLVVLARERHWFLALSIAWMALFWVSSPQVQGWHMLFALILFPVARLRTAGTLGQLAVLFVFAMVALIVYRHVPLPGWLLSQVVNYRI